MKPGRKYQPLYAYLQRSGQQEVALSFGEIEALLDDRLPASARTQRAWWSNRSVQAGQSTAWMGAGYHVVRVDLAAERVTFRKPTPAYTVQRAASAAQAQWDGELVKALRQHMGLTQTEMADQLGVRQQTISEWETGMYQPKRAMSKLLTLVAEQAGFSYRV